MAEWKQPCLLPAATAEADRTIRMGLPHSTSCPQNASQRARRSAPSLSFLPARPRQFTVCSLLVLCACAGLGTKINMPVDQATMAEWAKEKPVGECTAGIMERLPRA